MPGTTDEARGNTDRTPLDAVREFLHTESAGGVLLLAASVAALIWANSPWQDSYRDLWSHHLAIDLGVHTIDLSLGHWISDGLMTLFFFVVGLEIKRELVIGELRDPRRAALPAIAAVGGMVVPALIYAAFNAGGDGASGWGIPVATDIAMAVGVLSLLGSSVNRSLKIFLLALAIVDDVGAIVIIAIFYGGEFDGSAALVAGGLLVVVIACRLLGVQSLVVYVVLGTLLWVAVLDSGIHATLTGVVLALLAPARPRPGHDEPSVVERLEHRLHPYTSFLVVPLFALANAGVSVSGDSLRDAVSSPIAHGIVVGLVVGKLVGVSGATWLATRFGVGSLPDGVTWRGILGVSALAGIGFTVSLFVTSLAFTDPGQQDIARMAIIVASTTAAVLGTVILRVRPSTPSAATDAPAD